MFLTTLWLLPLVTFYIIVFKQTQISNNRDCVLKPSFLARNILFNQRCRPCTCTQNPVAKTTEKFERFFNVQFVSFTKDNMRICTLNVSNAFHIIRNIDNAFYLNMFLHSVWNAVQPTPKHIFPHLDNTDSKPSIVQHAQNLSQMVAETSCFWINKGFRPTLYDITHRDLSLLFVTYSVKVVRFYGYLKPLWPP